MSLSGTLTDLASLARIRGDRVEAELLVRGEQLIRERKIDSDADLGSLVETPPTGIDDRIIRPLRHLFEAGAWVILESAIADLPADLRWLYESGAVSVGQLALIHDRLGATALVDLAAAVDQQVIRSIEGLDENVEYSIAGALGDLRRSIPRIPLGRATTLIDPILAALGAVPQVRRALPIGSLRRAQDSVGDIEIAAVAAEPEPAIQAIAELPDIDRVLHRSARRLYLLINRAQIGLRFPDPANAGATLLHLTGSAAHFAALQARAAERGWRLDARGLHTPDDVLVPAETEEEIYEALALPFIAPEIRNGDEEVALAVRGELPSLVRREDIRGDLHMHSTWSDGRDSVEAMVRGCQALGYEYMAITDHSPHSGASRSLSVQTVKRQAEEVAALREQFPDIAILHGCEVDILPDGRLDFPERVLGDFDIVLASLHQGAGQGPEQLLDRYVAAMRNPLVTLITHPTNRLVPNRPGYALDYDRLFEAAIQTGTLLEIDGAPAHLDMDGALARRAVAAGVSVAIDSDCHRADSLARQMHLGVVTARRGWVQPHQVLNTRSLAEVRAHIARKRGG